ncbi:MAG: ankyrin repeat domain-containing protein [Gammaproteobacteria bacterium]
MSNELHQAALDGDVEKVRLLLEQGASPIEKDESGQYPIFCALELPVSGYHASDLRKRKEEICHLLLPYYEDIKAYHDSAGDTLLHYVAKYGYDVILLALKRRLGGDESAFFIENNFGQKPIHIAILSKKQFIFETLLAIQGMAAVNDWNQQNLIHHIAHYGTPEMLQFYCKHNDVRLYINAKDKTDRSPAQLALEFNTTSNVNQIIEILMAHGSAKAVRPLSPMRY